MISHGRRVHGVGPRATLLGWSSIYTDLLCNAWRSELNLERVGAVMCGTSWSRSIGQQRYEPASAQDKYLQFIRRQSYVTKVITIVNLTCLGLSKMASASGDKEVFTSVNNLAITFYSLH
ncbi:Uncharacterized protein HZ326_25383 [Fusarium oxysporum f. sp. albedinis]|nr:Uncharacterized protein HZ326_25383 [Fusarium oxysporum f. sp. albedinis]